MGRIEHYRDRLISALSALRIGEEEKKKRLAEYEEELSRQCDPYGEWIRYVEPGRMEESTSDAFAALIRTDDPEASDHEPGIRQDPLSPVIFARNATGFRPEAVDVCEKAFSTDPGLRLWYGDEDIVTSAGSRCLPWFKPEWSPFTLQSYFYLGSFFAIRLCDLEKLKPELAEEAKGIITYEEAGGIAAVRKLVLRLAFGSSILGSDEVLHTPAICYHTVIRQAGNPGRVFTDKEEQLDYRMLSNFRDICFEAEEAGKSLPGHAEKPGMGSVALTQETEDQDISPDICVVIPTRDHPEYLERLLSTFITQTDYPGERLKFRIVDNGSTTEHQEAYRELLSRLCSGNVGYSYEVKEEEFNFSAMCNRGAGFMTGQTGSDPVKCPAGALPDTDRNDSRLILFLNDDIEIITPDWLRRMADMAVQDGVGAVGAKLYYPCTEDPADDNRNWRIQHAGITNLTIGPGHKLLNRGDDHVFYYGYGTFMMEMLAVTGACLMVKRTAFEEAGGFDEDLAVAYNDVELCMKLYECGYRNVQMNDVTLIHHESATRGSDEAPDRRQRRLSEMDALYSRHPGFKGYDPYYSRDLSGDSDAYTVNYIYPYENRDMFSTVEQYSLSDIRAYEISTGAIHIDHVTDQASDVNVMEGWAYIGKMDNALFKRRLILTSAESSTCYLVSLFDKHRPDVESAFPEEQHLALSGFVARWKATDIPPGSYRRGIIFDTGSDTFLSWE